jgi:hypothetical protein
MLRTAFRREVKLECHLGTIRFFLNKQFEFEWTIKGWVWVRVRVSVCFILMIIHMFYRLLFSFSTPLFCIILSHNIYLIHLHYSIYNANGSNIYYEIKLCKIMALKRRKGNLRLDALTLKVVAFLYEKTRHDERVQNLVLSVLVARRAV